MIVTSTHGSPRVCRSARALIQLYIFTSTSLLSVPASSRASSLPQGICEHRPNVGASLLAIGRAAV
ncbi:hypothetical protein F7R20_05360 [Pseudomonas brassicacearum subsp. brassicacearum]|nr:hypothetical protein F7R20_05360 [Pseudomonas brassicacearum subsp. brassicacearum]QEO77753.1 hypothetical protein ELZ14_09365 [Pseudomonas brassicacearum]